MSLFNWVSVPVALLAVLGLSGCFKPMYAGASGQALIEELHKIEVDPVQGRFGHYLNDALLTEFNGTGGSYKPKYRLTLSPTERIGTPLVDTVTGQATSATLDVDVRYELRQISDKKLLTSGTAFSSASYNRSPNEYANVTAAQDAEMREANSLADQIRLRIASYFSRKNDAVSNK